MIEDDDMTSSIHEDAKLYISNEVKTFLIKLNQLFPDLVELQSNERARDFNVSSVSYKLKIVLDLDNTWLDNPPPEVAGDTVGSWPVHTDFPTMEKAYTPPGMGKYLPRKLPLVFEDQKIEKFLCLPLSQLGLVQFISKCGGVCSLLLKKYQNLTQISRKLSDPKHIVTNQI